VTYPTCIYWFLGEWIKQHQMVQWGRSTASDQSTGREPKPRPADSLWIQQAVLIFPDSPKLMDQLNSHSLWFFRGMKVSEVGEAVQVFHVLENTGVWSSISYMYMSCLWSFTNLFMLFKVSIDGYIFSNHPLNSYQFWNLNLIQFYLKIGFPWFLSIWNHKCFNHLWNCQVKWFIPMIYIVLSSYWK